MSSFSLALLSSRNASRMFLAADNVKMLEHRHHADLGVNRRCLLKDQEQTQRKWDPMRILASLAVCHAELMTRITNKKGWKGSWSVVICKTDISNITVTIIFLRFSFIIKKKSHYTLNKEQYCSLHQQYINMYITSIYLEVLVRKQLNLLYKQNTIYPCTLPLFTWNY